MPRILLIEDDDSVRTMLRLTLVNAGHAVVEAVNGKEGLALFHNANADLVITDLVMPEVEGFEVLRELRRIAPLVKIIAISGAGPDDGCGYLQVARVMGAAKVLAKPFSAAVLLATVGELLPGDV